MPAIAAEWTRASAATAQPKPAPPSAGLACIGGISGNL
jgi:hypothetical protein